MMKALVLLILGTFTIVYIVFWIWPALIPGWFGEKFAAEFAAESSQEKKRHPVEFWVMCAVGVGLAVWWIVVGAAALSK